jgi:hypothetical protein
MLSYNKREEKRAAIEEDLQIIDAGIERESARAFHSWIMAQLDETKNGENDQEITQLQDRLTDIHGALEQQFTRIVPQARLARAQARWDRLDEKPTGVDYCFERVGKFLVPKLATPAIILGALLTIFGAACLGMSITKQVPWIFEILTKNTPLSVLFASGLIITGLDSIHSGATMSEVKKKNKNKKAYLEARQELIYKLYPTLLRPEPIEAVAPRTLSGNQEANLASPPVANGEKREEMAKELTTFFEQKGWYGFWVKNLNKMWMIHAGLASFLLTSSILGLLMAMGVHIPNIDFISKDPSFSTSFCIGLLAVAADGINTAWRMGKYKSRKKQDADGTDLIIRCKEGFDTLFPPQPLPQQLPIDQRA